MKNGTESEKTMYRDFTMMAFVALVPLFMLILRH